MKTARLYRIESDADCTRGVLTIDDRYLAVTLENPWLDNQRDISCIPAGEYLCRRVASPRFGDTFEVTGVDGRSHILFHPGNSARDTKGCILLGLQLAYAQPRLASSRFAMANFMTLLANVDEFRLVIIDSWRRA